MLGGDHAIPIPVFRAYEGQEPMVVVQLDQHIDWREERNGVTQGLSSTMRRASEMPWVSGMAQIGLHAVGSARQQEVDDSLAYGSVQVRAEEVHEIGVDAVLERIPRSERYYITFDADGLYAPLAPGVLSPGFGGLTYYEASNLLRGVARKGKIVGYDIVEIVPSVDVADMTSQVCARLTLNLIGEMAHQGQIGRKGRRAARVDAPLSVMREEGSVGPAPRPGVPRRTSALGKDESQQIVARFTRVRGSIT